MGYPWLGRILSKWDAFLLEGTTLQDVDASLIGHPCCQGYSELMKVDILRL